MIEVITVVHLFVIIVVLVVIAVILHGIWGAVEDCVDIYDKDYMTVGALGNGGCMVRVLEVIEVNGKDYVPLEEYQKLMSEYEKLMPASSNEEIIKAAGEDEVYTG